MDLERHPRPAPRERTFAQLFPWRSIRRALMLVVLIVAIVIIKRRMGAFLEHAGQLWGPVSPAPAAASHPAGTATVHLGPSLAPPTTPPR
ncbi:MAG TPA: hypothetical protein VGP07_15735 [Polyangia bacterium]|jgi:hypothetical protein